MRGAGDPITIREAYARILKNDLYTFHAENLYNVLSTQIRRDSEGIDFPSSSPTKHFKLIGDDKFMPLSKPRRIEKTKKRNRGSHLLAVH